MANDNPQQTQPIDLSAGLVPDSTPSTPNPTQPSIDLSAGFTGAQAQPQTQTAPEVGHISAVPQPTTYIGKVARWVENVSNDLKYGTDETGIGTVLKKMGAHGVYSGNPEAVGDYMASLPLGLLKAVKGGAEVAPQVIGGPKGRTWQGLKDVISGGLQASEMPASVVAPEATAEKGASLARSSEDIGTQVTKDAIKHVLGNKADADIVNEAASRIGKTKMFSTVENELKLVKPQIDAEIAGANSQLDDVLSGSTARIQDAGTQLHRVFDDMIQKARAGVGDTADAERAINAVRDRILPKIGDGDLSVQDANDLKRLVGDEIKKFQPPDMLNTAGKNEQEAYRQAYFRLRDLVSEAAPETEELNSKISKGINLQNLLERKFPHLETPEAAQSSYQGVRRDAAKKVAGSVAKKVAGGAATALGAGGVYEAAKTLLPH